MVHGIVDAEMLVASLHCELIYSYRYGAGRVLGVRLATQLAVSAVTRAVVYDGLRYSSRQPARQRENRDADMIVGDAAAISL